jgi:hypothetical protein
MSHVCHDLFCLQLVYKELEQQFADSYDAAAAARQQERQQLLQGGEDDYPCQACDTLRDQHPANILVVRWVPGGHQVITGSGEYYRVYCLRLVVLWMDAVMVLVLCMVLVMCCCWCDHVLHTYRQSWRERWR